MSVESTRGLVDHSTIRPSRSSVEAEILGTASNESVVAGTPEARLSPEWNRRGLAPIPLAAFLFAIVSLGLFVIGSRSGVDLKESSRQLGLAVMLLSWVPALSRLAAKKANQDVRPVPFLEIVSVLYGMYFGLPGVVGPGINPIANMVSGTSHVSALTLAWLGLVSMFAGVYLVGGVLPGIRLRMMVAPDLASRSRTQTFAVLVLGFGLLMDIARTRGVGGGLGQIIPLLGLFAEVGLASLTILALRGALERWAWIALLVGGFLYVFLRVGEGSVAQAVFPTVALCLTIWGVGRRVPVSALVVLVALVVLLRGNADRFREETWSEGSTGASSLAQSERFMEMAKESAGADGAGSIDLVLARMNQLAILGYVFGETPSLVPYWNGETYRTALASLVPRVIWPSKPTKVIGQEFGHRYQILHPEDESTSINLPLLVEMYVNFGWNGAILGMLLLGVLYRWLMDLINRPGLGEGMVVVAAITMSRMLNIESDFSLTFGALPFQIAALVMVTRFIFKPATRREQGVAE